MKSSRLRFVLVTLAAALAAGFGLSPNARAAEPQRLVVAPDHADAAYAPGETVRWRVEWNGDGTPEKVDYVLRNGGLREVRKGTLTSLPGNVEAKIDAPGTLLLEVKGGDARAVGGAVAAAHQIKPSSPRPDDFDAFWDAKLKELQAVPPDPQLEPADGGKAGVDYWKVTLDNVRGAKIRGQLARPKQGDKLPALLIVQWAGVYPLQKDWVNGHAANGWLVLNISAHDLPIDEPDAYYQKQQQPGGPAHNYPAAGNDDRDASYFLRMYLSCFRAAEYLATRADWDGKTLAVMGASQGGQQALVTAALHPKVTAAMANVPAGCDMLGPEVGRQPGWPMWYWQVGEKDPKKVREASRYFDVVNFAPRIKAPVLIGIGLRDETCPPAGIYAAANQITSPKELVPLPRGGHQNENGSHAAYDRRCWGDWLPALREGKPAPVVPSASATSSAVLVAAQQPAATAAQKPAAPNATGASGAAAAKSEPYAWRNVAIVGGGFHSGIVTHPKQQGLMYLRTDIGGAYRRDAAGGRWEPMTDWVDQERWTYTGIESVAIDPSDPKFVYLAAGSYTNDWSGPGAMLRSADQGRTWQVTPLPIKLGGNEDGRGNGERLSVDPNRGSILLFGSRNDGLWRSDDASVTWSRVESFPADAAQGGPRNIGIVFTAFDPRSGKPGASASSVVYAGVSSPGAHLYRSTDGGRAWAPVPGQPAGMLPHHYAWDGDDRTLYLTYGNGPGPNGVTDGAVYKLDTDANGWTNVTPVKPEGRDRFGYAGVTADPRRPGVVMVSTLNRWGRVDDVFRSTDGGGTWVGLREKSVRDPSAAPWLTFGKAEAPIGHWIHDIEIDPFDSDRLIYGTGWGMWETANLTDADAGLPTRWTVPVGTEMVVVNEVASPPAGAQLLSAMWDLDGFRHEDLDRSPAGGFFRPHYGRNTSVDFAEQKPDVVARVYGGQEMGGTERAGTCGSYSLDNGRTWTAFKTKPPVAAKGDGTVAVSADGATFVWTPDGSPTYVSGDRGDTWAASRGLPPRLRVIADRANAKAFYAVDRDGTLYASADGGATFVAKQDAGLPRPAPREGRGGGGGGGGRDAAYLRAVPGHAGHLWAATPSGLFASADGGATFRPVPGPDAARRLGFGKAAPGHDYPAVFFAGRVGGTYGFYRSDDRGANWVRINDDQHQFAEIASLTGDPRVHGRVYLASRNRGILYGQPTAAGAAPGK